MKRRDMAAYIAGGLLVGGVIAWTMTRVEPPRPAPVTAAVTSVAPPIPTQSLESIPRISVADLSQRLDRGEVVVIDVRDADSYVASHVPGAMQIPLSYIPGELPYLPRGKPIVTYCT
jgi:3-mercaptopyruvate sulfurtransferase SseA